MAGRSAGDSASAWRWMPAMVLTVVVVVGLALAWGGLTSARAQDQAKWWGGAANIEPCTQAEMTALIDAIDGKGSKGGLVVQCTINPNDYGTASRRAAMAVKYVLLDIRVNGRTVKSGKAMIWVGTVDRICDDRRCSNLSSEGWGVMSCGDAERLKADVLKAIKYPFSTGAGVCDIENVEYKSGVRGQWLHIVFDPKVAAAPAKSAEVCDKSALLGAWKNDDARYARYGASVAFERSTRAGELLGRFGFQRQKEQLSYILANTIETSGPAKGCLFPADVGSSLKLEHGLKYDKATDSFAIVRADGSADPHFPGRWTRGSPPKPAATCGKDDINGTWHRADGARILMTGVGVLGGGGHAIMERYPEDRWPKGETKFSGVKEVDQCRYEANCTSIVRRTTNGVASYGVDRATCTLTLDPAKRTLSATGGNGLFSRVAPASSADADARAEAEAAKARDAAAEAERTAKLNREIAERDAAIKRRNAEARAADERRQREYRDALARQQAEAERLKREEAAARARYEAEMAAWRAKVAACRAGDVSQCQ